MRYAIRNVRAWKWRMAIILTNHYCIYRISSIMNWSLEDCAVDIAIEMSKMATWSSDTFKWTKFINDNTVFIIAINMYCSWAFVKYIFAYYNGKIFCICKRNSSIMNVDEFAYVGEAFAFKCSDILVLAGNNSGWKREISIIKWSNGSRIISSIM